MGNYQGSSLTAAATPLPPRTYSACSTCQCNFFAEYGSTSVFLAMLLGYSDINMSTGPGIFIKIKKVNGELINRLMSRTPCNSVADHQEATDPWLKTPVLEVLRCQHVCHKC